MIDRIYASTCVSVDCQEILRVLRGPATIMYKSSLYTNHLWALDRREPRRYVTFLAATKFLDACGYLHAANGAKCIKYIQIVCDLDSTPGHPILLTAC